MTILNTSNWWLSHAAGAPDADWLANVRAMLGVDGGGALSPRFTTMGAPGQQPWLYSTLPAPITAPQPSPGAGGVGSPSLVTPTTTASSEPPPSDPFFDDQWHFNFLGDIQKIWEEYTGDGVHVGIYDDGVEYTHPDLAANYDLDSQLTIFGDWLLDALEPTFYGYPHGTSVAGLIAAARDGEGTVGVAYGSTITGVPIFSGIADINYSFDGFIEALNLASEFDIISNSWGVTPAFYQGLLAQNDAINAGWLHAVEEGRDGLGTIVVKAAGNDNMNANGDGADTTRATIIVGAYDATGDASYYSNYGANLLVSAPSSGNPLDILDPNNVPDPGLVTTDLVGGNGYNLSTTPFQSPDDYTDQFGGTSGATPIVSGVIALMLDANPDLGWRDVQNILAYSARELGSGVGGLPTSSENHEWFYNGADNWNGGGLHFSQDYGYGAIDAYNAARMAEVWGLFAAPQTSDNETSFTSSLSGPIALDDLTSTDIKFDFSGAEFDVDFVNVDLDITHSSVARHVIFFLGNIDAIVLKSLADISIQLISPDGTVVELADFTNDIIVEDGSLGLHLSFGANAFRGEDADGTWTLRISDAWFGNDAGSIDSATVTLHGRDGSQVNLDDDVYHYTSEVFTSLARDASRLTLTDSGGNDWLDFAAMSGNLVVRLGEGQTSTGTSTTGVRNILTIAAGTEIENAVTGDGNDHITGNGLGNKIHGMRGNDTILGEGGADTLSGGAGNDTLTGGIGQDMFLFDRAFSATTNVDIITDFSHLDDTVWLDIAIFSGLVSGALDINDFYIGTGAHDGSDRIIYDSLTGALYYDADGSSTAFAQIQFATLSNHPIDLSFDDFTVISTDPDAIVTTTDRTAAPPDVVISAAEAQGSGVIFGTDAGETLRGDAGDNQIFGAGGDDVIETGAGNNYVDAGAGLDVIFAEDGNDVIIGGGSPLYYGDYVYAGGGDDIVIGSDDQINDEAWRMIFGHGDVIAGQAGNDKIYGLNGDDVLSGNDGDDLLVGGNGSDNLLGDAGDDRLIAGLGEANSASGGEGVDTVVFQGSSDEYRYFILDLIEPAFTGAQWVYVERISAAGVERTAIDSENVELLEFTDRTIDVSQNLVIERVLPGFLQQFYADVNVDVDAYEIGVVVDKAAAVTITDSGKENGSVDKLQAVYVEHAYGEVNISSDALTLLELGFLGKHYFSGGWHHDAMTESVTVHAAAGTRELTLDLLQISLAENAKIIDDTATSVRYNSTTGATQGWTGDHLNGAGVNGYNLSFASATSFTFDNTYGATIKWYIPNVTTITAPVVQFSPILHETRVGNQTLLTIETPLDDMYLATAGGSEAYSFSGSLGREHIRFGNLGDVRMSNDGTVGDEAGTNLGLGLRGTINLQWGDDEARILGTGAFKDGGTLDGGVTEFVIGGVPEQTEINGDTIRMTFGVAAAIGDISEHISNFEILQLDRTAVAGQVVDVANFDSMSKVTIAGNSTPGGDNTVVGLLDDSLVTMRSVTEGLQEGPVDFGEGFYVFDTYGSEFGTTNFDMIGDGTDDTLNLSFIGLATDGLDQGTIHVLDAETINITTNSHDWDYYTDPFDPNVFNPPLSFEPTDAFAQILDLDATTSIYLSGNTGWDFTVAGTDIGKVTLIDASGINAEQIAFYGAVGAVKATAQTTAAVTFIGGFGDDEFTGGDGNDTLAGGDYGNDLLDGGAGTDRAVFAGAWSDYDIQVADGVVTLTSLLDGTVDTVRGVELFKFANGTVTLANLGTGEVNEPPSVSLENVLASLAENASTVARIKVADIVINDDAIYGNRQLSLTGRDAMLFEIVGMALFLKAGVLLDATTMTDLQVAVAVDDDGIDGAPDGVSPTLTLVIEDEPNFTVVRGTSASETVNGTAGDDYIDGQGGDDSLRGGAGDDTYIVDSARDRVVESRNQGTDTVRSSVTHTLASNVENLTLTGAGNINGTGNSAANVITGNAGDNVLKGGSGNDTIYGEGGNDRIDGDSGNDLIDGGDGDDYLDGDKGTDTASYASAASGVAVDLNLRSAQNTGGGGTDTLRSFENVTGSAYADTLVGTKKGFIDGGAGADSMRGGSSTNTYFVDDVGDTVTEQARGGTDTVLSSATFALGANVENLTLTGGAAIDGTGNELANRITGNSAANVLTGGAGRDVFIFNTTPGEGNVDSITDFNVADDTMHIDNAWFLGVGRNGSLSSGAFAFGTGAADSSDRIIYDQDTGALYFDADGNGAGEKVQFAQLEAHLALTNRDFLIV